MYMVVVTRDENKSSNLIDTRCSYYSKEKLTKKVTSELIKYACNGVKCTLKRP